jgi:hypothetical protein
MGVVIPADTLEFTPTAEQPVSTKCDRAGRPRLTLPAPQVMLVCVRHDATGRFPKWHRRGRARAVQRKPPLRKSWMQQIARNVTMEGCGALRDCRYLLHDRDNKYTQSFRAIIASGQVEPLVLPARSPNLKCLCGALGQVGEGGVPVQGGFVW